jgi:type I restriction enzyme R subunit
VGRIFYLPTEADTCRKFVVPKLQSSGWDNEPHSIAEQLTITDGRIVPVGKGFVRKPPKRADYLLRYRRDFSLAVLEAKAAYKSAADGLQQAKAYAEMLGLKFAYATNGNEIIEFDYFTGIESPRVDYPTPQDLWRRYRAGSGIKSDDTAERLLTPFNHEVGKGERYYQQIAINRTVEAILNGRHRLLITMATGTGKTAVAFQICWKLWSARWNRTGEHRRPKILYLADRNILVDQPKMASSPPSATRAPRSNRARSSRVARCTSPSIRRWPRTSAASASSSPSRPISSISSSSMNATAAARATTAPGARSSITSRRPTSWA